MELIDVGGLTAEPNFEFDRLNFRGKVLQLEQGQQVSATARLQAATQTYIAQGHSIIGLYLYPAPDAASQQAGCPVPLEGELRLAHPHPPQVHGRAHLAVPGDLLTLSGTCTRIQAYYNQVGPLVQEVGEVEPAGHEHIIVVTDGSAVNPQVSGGVQAGAVQLEAVADEAGRGHHLAAVPPILLRYPLAVQRVAAIKGLFDETGC